MDLYLASLGFEPPSHLTGRAAIRFACRDRLPMVGAVPDAQSIAKAQPHELASMHRLDRLPRLPGVFCALGLGGRGLLWSALAAQLLSAQMSTAFDTFLGSKGRGFPHAHQPLPLEGDLVDALDPARFEH